VKNEAAIKERYLRDPLPIRLGGLAANLARIQSFSEHPKNRDVVKNILEESKFFIEWTAREAKPEFQAELVTLQRQLSLWHYGWNVLWADETLRHAVAEKAGRWSQRVLEASGLLSLAT
jgi:hypothetical protein